MKYYSTLLVVLTALSSCKEGSSVVKLENKSGEYWDVYIVEDCSSLLPLDPSHMLPLLGRRWIFKDKLYDLYIVTTTGEIKLGSLSSRDYIVEQSWQLKADTLIMAGDSKFLIKSVNSDSLTLTMRSNDCISYKGTSTIVQKAKLVYALARKKGNVLER